MSDIQEQESQVAEAQAAQVGGNDEVESLKAQLALLKQNNDKLLTEKQNQAESMKDLQRKMAEKSQRDLAERGDWKQLYDDLKKTHDAELLAKSELQKQLEDERAGRQRQTIEQKAIAAMQQAGAINPEDAYRLYQDKIKLDDNGNVVAWDGGVSHDINDFCSSLKNPESNRAYLFSSSGARGMSAVGTTSQGSGEANPYLTGNFAAVLELEERDPQRAAQLKVQAGK